MYEKFQNLRKNDGLYQNKLSVIRRQLQATTPPDKRRQATMTKARIEATYKDLLENMQATYMAEDNEKEKYEKQSQEIIDGLKSDEYATDGFKNLLFARYKECVYESVTYPFFSCEDEFVMETLEALIKSNYGEDFCNTHRLEQTHWMFADGTYNFLFEPDFIETVY